MNTKTEVGKRDLDFLSPNIGTNMQILPTVLSAIIIRIKCERLVISNSHF